MAFVSNDEKVCDFLPIWKMKRQKRFFENNETKK